MKKIGDLGEHLVARWLQLQNYEILQHNWRCRWGEIDLIARNGNSDAIAFVEVKTRSVNNWDADGLLAITASKQQKLLKTASLFIAAHPYLEDIPCRFDVALVGYQDNCLTESKFKYQKILDSIAISQVEIAQTIAIDETRLTLKDYLKNAFD